MTNVDEKQSWSNIIEQIVYTTPEILGNIGMVASELYVSGREVFIHVAIIGEMYLQYMVCYKDFTNSLIIHK